MSPGQRRQLDQQASVLDVARAEWWCAARDLGIAVLAAHRAGRAILADTSQMYAAALAEECWLRERDKYVALEAEIRGAS